jgi:ABC-type antimicrobial peptide transport system permease subunit
LNLDTAQRLWGGDYGAITSIRIPADKSAKFADDLLAELDPAALGLSFTAVKAKQIAASSSGGEFAMTFVAFSFFLIAAAVLLTAMLFALSVEQRAGQLGLLQATGFSPRRLRRMVLAEGMLVALAGALVGGAAAVGYTGLMMLGLRTRWVGAVGTTQLHLHVEPLTLAGGIVATLIIAWAAMLWGVWRVAQAQPARLLAGQWGGDEPGRHRRSRVAYAIASASAVLGITLLALGKWRLPADQQSEAFLGGGALFLVAALSALAGWLRRGGRAAVDSLGSLALRNAARKPSRSLLTAALIACATFILTIVAGMRQQGPLDVADPHSGAGGFRLMLRADIGLMGDPATQNGRELLGISPDHAPLWSHAKFISLRRWAGQDVSCLNMTRPTDPTILAVPQSLVERNAFQFAALIKPAANPWTLLDSSAAMDQPVPIIADANTAAYILQIGLGDQITLHDANGTPRSAKLVGTLAGSIFQGELLMGEANFRKLYPDQSGFGVVLIDVPASQADALQKSLDSELDAYAVSVDATSKVLAAYDDVGNTYLATFKTLGSLGLLLGVLGLAVVLLRAMAERRAELAMLGAIGLNRRQKTWLVLAENLFLLAIGLVMGLACALLAVAPVVVGAGRHIGWTGLLAALVAVTATAIVALVLAVGWGSARISAADFQAA